MKIKLFLALLFLLIAFNSCLAGRRVYILTSDPAYAAESLSYVHSDHLGSTSLVTDENGNIISQQVYYPYGSTRLATNNLQLATERQYTGQVSDQVQIDLYYYQTRYYSSPFALFTQPDRARGPNRYAYVAGNPVNRTDPTGQEAGGGKNAKITVPEYTIDLPTIDYNYSSYVYEPVTWDLSTHINPSLLSDIVFAENPGLAKYRFVENSLRRIPWNFGKWPEYLFFTPKFENYYHPDPIYEFIFGIFGANGYSISQDNQEKAFRDYHATMVGVLRKNWYEGLNKEEREQYERGFRKTFAESGLTAKGGFWDDPWGFWSLDYIFTANEYRSLPLRYKRSSFFMDNSDTWVSVKELDIMLCMNIYYNDEYWKKNYPTLYNYVTGFGDFFNKDYHQPVPVPHYGQECGPSGQCSN